MKVVINKCFGGFGLSDEAEDLYAKKAGFELFRYKQTRYKYKDGEDLFERGGGSPFSYTFKKDFGDCFYKFPNDEYWYSREIERDDKILVSVVEELGEKANGYCSELGIVEIPDGISYTIEEYDGNEHIAEVHKTWN
jgi:hypothetical protein